MEPLESLPAWAQVGVSGVALATLVYVFTGMRSLFREFMKWSGNHMSLVTKALIESARANQNVADALETLTHEIRRGEDRHDRRNA